MFDRNDKRNKVISAVVIILLVLSMLFAAVMPAFAAPAGESGPGVQTESPADGGAAETETADTESTGVIPDDQKSSFQVFFENYVFDTVFDTGTEEDNENNPFTTLNLVNRSFTWTIAAVEGSSSSLISGSGADIFPSDGIVHQSWYVFLQCIAVLIMLMRFMSDYAMDKVWQTADHHTPEQLFKPIFRLLCGFLFILLVHYFLSFGMYLSHAAFHAMSSGIETASSASSDVAKDTLTQMLGFEKKGITHVPQNIGALLMGVLVFILPLLVSMIASVGTLFVCFSRVLELIVRAVFAPLAVTDCYKAGDGAHGFKYIMEYFGIAFQCVAILAVLWASSYVCQIMFANIREVLPDAGAADYMRRISNIAMYIAGIKLAQLVLMLKTGQITKSVFGA